MSALAKLLGSSTLKDKAGSVAVETLASKKYFLLYFSAHWCPPCRQFTPLLSQTYAKLNESRADFEIIWVSWDESEPEFNEYFEEHPWLALPFAERSAQEALTKKFGIETIPSLVVLDENLEVLTTKARDLVPEDPEGKNFPWGAPVQPALTEPATAEQDAPASAEEASEVKSEPPAGSVECGPDGCKFVPKSKRLQQQQQQQQQQEAAQ